jgi:hypothetical protein
METINSATSIRVPWNKGKLVGQKAPFKLKERFGGSAFAYKWQVDVESSRYSTLAVDSKLRACDLIQLRVRDVCHGVYSTRHQLRARRARAASRRRPRRIIFSISNSTAGPESRPF